MIYALHGFLGLSQDWDFLKNTFDIEAENLWLSTSLTMQEWAEKKSLEIASRPGPKILLGYSMGGRLAMHLFLANPKIWDAAIFVSANPGTSDIHEREIRKKLDLKWAQKILKNDWSALTAEWNHQSLFHVKNRATDAIDLRRDEQDFDRSKLAEALEKWSIAHQENLAVRLAQISQPVLWIAGEEDEKYRDLLSGFSQVSKHQFAVVSQAAHRTPWDHPSEFTKILSDFLNSILLVDSAKAKNQ